MHPCYTVRSNCVVTSGPYCTLVLYICETGVIKYAGLIAEAKLTGVVQTRVEVAAPARWEHRLGRGRHLGGSGRMASHGCAVGLAGLCDQHHACAG